MANSGNLVVSNTTPTGQLVKSNGEATFAFLKWMQNVGTSINGAFDSSGNYQGPIGSFATINGRATLASIVQYISTGGVVQPHGIDFALAYLNKDTDHINDGDGNPLAGGKAAYLALLATAPSSGDTLRFTGSAWETVPIAVNKNPVLNQWLKSYDDTTGQFSSTQPDFSSISGTAAPSQVPVLSAISGQITTGQLPASGLSVTITTAALTGLGSQGSMTFTNGILTAQVQAT